MFRTEVDRAKKLLRIAFSGDVGVEEARRCGEQAASLLAGLGQGFRLLTDLSGLESMEVDCAPQIERLMDLCNQHGVETVVRIIPDPHKDIGLNIMSLFHYRRGVRIVTCESVVEAERALAL
jgi:hypothetical protein